MTSNSRKTIIPMIVILVFVLLLLLLFLLCSTDQIWMCCQWKQQLVEIRLGSKSQKLDTKVRIVKQERRCYSSGVALWEEETTCSCGCRFSGSSTCLLPPHWVSFFLGGLVGNPLLLSFSEISFLQMRLLYHHVEGSSFNRSPNF